MGYRTEFYCNVNHENHLKVEVDIDGDCAIEITNIDSSVSVYLNEDDVSVLIKELESLLKLMQL